MSLKKSQSILEYVVLFSVIVFALLMGQNFIKRAYQGRIKTQMEQVGSQYSPGHTTSLIVTETRTHTHTVTENGITRTDLTSQDGYDWTTKTVSKEAVDALATEDWPE